jgi:hypothetical protein
LAEGRGRVLWSAIMKDLNLRRTINVLAFSSLTMSVLACGGRSESDGDGDDAGDGDRDGPGFGNRPEIAEGDGGVSPEESFCEAVLECNAGFEEEYGSVSDCAEGFETYAELFEDEYGAACARAFGQFLACSGEALAEDCDPNALEECETERDSFYAECGYEGDYYDDYDVDGY